MPIFNILNTEIENFLECLNSVILTEENLSEKIMTKKQAKRRKKRLAKKRAEKIAKQKAEQEKINAEQTTDINSTTDDDVIDVEFTKEEENAIIQAASEEDDSSNSELVDNPTALVVYDKAQDNGEEDYNQVTPEFIEILQKLQEIFKKYQDAFIKANEEWKKAGEDKACPIEVWNAMDAAYKDLKTSTENLLTSIDTDKLAQPELVLLDRCMDCANGYIDKAGKEITAVKPNLSEDDFKAPVKKDTTAVSTDVDSKNIETKEVDAEVVSDNNDNNSNKTNSLTIKNQDDKKEVEKELSNKKKKNKIITYGSYIKGMKHLNSGCGELVTIVANLVKDAVSGACKKILSLSLAPADWINDKLFGFLTSPLAKDFVKTLAYSNPFTAFIFDGNLGDFSITNALNKLKTSLKNKIEKSQQQLSTNKNDKLFNKNNFTERSFPRDVSKMVLADVQKCLYRNANMVACINAAYNHRHVKTDDKALLKKYVETFANALKNKDIEKARNTIMALTKLLNKICDYMNWETPKDWKIFSIKSGNTETEEADIEKKKKGLKEPGNDEESKMRSALFKAIKTLKSVGTSDEKILDTLSDSDNEDREYDYKYNDVKNMLDKYNEQAKKKLADKSNKEKQESYYKDTKELLQLCETALA